jgi:Fe-S cluster assembly protein SufD
MELKEKLISSFMAFEENLDLNSEVHNIRSKSFNYFEKNGFPTKKNESWK